ncbi:hypothetical protein ACFYO0_38170 [Streptomyces sp. NPDC006365]|uniref:hypothetical protein n=1 Tax=Streptomyces sp. NPDC006365 TaxID=3364744 RepID=UPI0036CF3CC0
MAEPIRQLIECVKDPLKGQLALERHTLKGQTARERHGGRTPTGRILQAADSPRRPSATHAVSPGDGPELDAYVLEHLQT